MQQLALGFWPKSRHTRGLGQHRQARAKIGGQELTYHAVLLQGRGDWAFYNSVIDFPSWSNKKHMLEVQGLQGCGFWLQGGWQ